MPYAAAFFRPDKGGTGPHADHHRAGLSAQRQPPHPYGGELLHLLCGDVVDVAVYIRRAHAGEGDFFHVLQLEGVGEKKVAHCAVQGCDGVLCLDAPLGDDGTVRTQSDDLGGGAADIYS